MPIRPIPLVLVATSVALLGASGCGGDSTSVQGGGSSSALPSDPAALSTRLSATDEDLRAAIASWRRDGAGGLPPPAVAGPAQHVQRIAVLLSDRPPLAAATLRRLPTRLRREVSELTAALRDLHRLSAGWPAHRVRTGPPAPLDRLLRFYRSAQRRFGVAWSVLASINLVESAFGRLRGKSVAGAQGPMQFLGSTWRRYGMGGNVHDPHDAVLGAANLLHQAGAPGSYPQAIYSYNPSPLYVDAVQRYARLIVADRDAIYMLYSWRAG